MKYSKKELEQLSAYIDNELTSDEAEKIKNKILTDSLFKVEYEELKKIKELAISIEPLPESQYFESKFNPNVNSGFKSNIKKYAPVYGFVLITVFLMLIMKFDSNSFRNLIENQTANVLDFYTSNLRPLFASNEISKEDVFNFALYQKLPIDKESSQFLQLGFDNDGNEFFEINSIDSNLHTNNFEEFVSSLQLNKNQRKQMDSILNFYARELESKVLVNDNNTLAINSGMWNYNKAIAAEILAFASNANKTAFDNVIPSQYHIKFEPELVKAIDFVKSENNNFVFINPDTVFAMAFMYNLEDENDKNKSSVKGINKKNIKKNFVINLGKDSSFYHPNHKTHNSEIFYTGNNSFKVMIPEIYTYVDFSMPNIDSILNVVDKATWHLKSPKFKNAYSYAFSTDDKSNSVIAKALSTVNIDSIVRTSIKTIDTLNVLSKVFEAVADSITKTFAIPNFPIPPIPSFDSLVYNSKDFEKQMKNYEKQMKEFEKQLQSEIKKKTNSEKKKRTEVNK